MDPRLESTQSPFAAAQDAPKSLATLPTIPARFRLSLVSDGVEIGQLGCNSSGWCIIVPNGQGVIMSMYNYGNNWYIRQAEDNSKYLSVSNQAYAGFYGWSGASAMKFTESGNLNCAYNNQNLSFYSTDNGYLYFWDRYKVLAVTAIAAPVAATA